MGHIPEENCLFQSQQPLIANIFSGKGGASQYFS